MRSAGENAPGPATGRRHAAADPDLSPQSGPGGQRQHGGESLFAPGYSANREPAARRHHEPARHAARYGPEGGVPGKGPVRGYPPLPGQLPPLYPPGRFSAWNRHARRDGADEANGTGDPGLAGGPAGPGPAADGQAQAFGQARGSDDPGYSVLAVRDPAADDTVTQTWGAVDDDRVTGSWADNGPGAGDAAEPGGTAPPDSPPSPEATAAPDSPAASVAQDRPPAAQRPSRERREAGGHRQTGSHPVLDGSAGGRRGRTRRGLLAASLAAVVALGAGAYYASRSSAGPAKAAPAAPASRAARPKPQVTTSPSPSATPLGPWGHIETRAIDPVPLTLAELFPASYAVGRLTYSRTVRRVTASCTAALIGARLRSAVRSAGCSQVMRASYLSARQQVMGTIGVLNMPSFQAAEQAGGAAGPTQFIAQLPAARGLTRKLTKGTGIEEADVKGHYLILVWGEFTTLRAPSTKAKRKALELFLNSMINNTVNHSLTSRMVDGKPGVP